MIDLNEAHDQSTITGNVNRGGDPLVVITADTGTFDSFLDSGGGLRHDRRQSRLQRRSTG